MDLKILWQIKERHNANVKFSAVKDESNISLELIRAWIPVGSSVTDTFLETHIEYKNVMKISK